MKLSRPHWAGGMRRVVMTGNPTQQLSRRNEDNHEQGCERGHVSHHAAFLHRRQGFPNRDLAPSLHNIHPRLGKQPSPDAERCTGGHGSSSGSGTKPPAFESLLWHSVGHGLGHVTNPLCASVFSSVTWGVGRMMAPAYPLLRGSVSIK